MLTRTLTSSLTALAATTLLAAGPAIGAPAPTEVADIETGSGSYRLLRELACPLAILAGSSFSLTEAPPAVCLLRSGA
ncbi:hypothetical protein [Nocardia salmonicida]|uniref:hypothetical protein n=1 Tax=Nocardia salmonicida TaxID=53431 RepID=UPI0037A37D8B